MANTAPTFSALKSFGILTGPFYSDAYSSLEVDPTGNLLLAGNNDGIPWLEGLTSDGGRNIGALGGDGYAELPVAPSEDTFLRLSDGRMLVAGFFTDENSALRLRVYRLLSDGSIDTTFGTGGYAEKVLSGDLGNAVVAMAVQTDGKVVVGTRPGTIFGDSTGNFIAVRFDAAGNLDTTFGSGGVVNQSIGSGLDVVDSIQIQSDGKILIAGSTANGRAQLTDFALMRLNPDGSLDAGFNGTGKLVVPVSSGDFDHPVRLLLQADGQILLVGYSNLGNRFGPSVIRVNGDGTLDSSFGTAGKVIVNIPGYSNTITSATLQADGKLVLVGSSTVTDGDTDCLVLRLNVDGSLDTSFGGGDGVVRIPAGYAEYPWGGRMEFRDYAEDITVLPDGRILIAGQISSFSASSQAVLVRLLPDGSLDPTFQPAYQNTLGGATSYVVDDAPVVLDPSVNVFDAELAALNGGLGDYGGARLTLSRDGGAQAADQFGIGGDFIQVGSTIQLAGAVVATVAQTPGVWVLTFSANVEQSTVDALLSSITYANDGSDVGGRFDILWSFNDGNAGVQGSGGSLAATGRTTVTVDGQVMNVITGTDQAETLTGGVAADEISGLGGNDRLIGDGGDDVLDGGAGADTLEGGSGHDVYYVESAGDVVTEALAGVEGGVDIVVSSINYTLGAHLEHLMLVGAATIGTGNELANILFGGDLADTLNGLADTDSLMGGGGNDSLDGGTGADTMAGEAGDDSYRVDNVGDLVVEAAGGGTDQVITSVNYTLAAGVAVETLTLSGTATVLIGNEFDNTLAGGGLADSLNGGAGNDSLSGGLGADTLLGGAGNDTLNGGTGADSLVGSLGDDLYIVDNAGDILVESAGSGTDRLWTSVNYTLAGGVAIETLTLTGSATALTGNEFAQTINGSSLADSLNGAAGNDNLVGNAGADTLVGGADNDTLNGGAGIDSLVGGTGHDLYMIDSAADVIVEVAAEGSDRLWASVNYTLAAGVSVETLTLTGTATRIGGNEFAQTIYGGSLADSLDGAGAADSLIGGAGNDSLLGGEGSDTLVGGTGVDNMAGGLGDDLYWVDSASDVIVEAAGEGADRVWASVNFTLATGVAVETITAVNGATALTGNDLANTLYGGVSADSLDGAGGADSLVGNAGADTLIGGDGADTLNGGAGVDRLVGGLGDDLYVIDAASDVIVEAAGEGSDRLWASANYTLAAGVSVESMTLLGTATGLTGNEGANNLYGSAQGDTLNGGAGNDTVNGAAGNDTLYGGLGNDTLTGGAGSDRFVFDSAPAAGTNVDTINDFAAGDLIALDNDVFTALGAAGALSPTAWHSGAGLTGANVAGQTAGVYYNTSTGGLYYDADGFGGMAAVQFATLTTKPGLAAGSFLVVE